MKTFSPRRSAGRGKVKAGLSNGRLSPGRLGGPAWEIAALFPEQGDWNEEDYLALPGNRLIELSDGVIEVLPMPTTLHQWIAFYLSKLLDAFVLGRRLGLTLPAGIRVRLWSRKFRQPDVVMMLEEHRDRLGEEFWDGADLVMEVVSDDPKDRRRDLITKREEYARAKVPEYWMVDPKLEEITVLWLKGRKYQVHGIFKPGQIATSRLLPEFEVAVSDVFGGPSA